MKDKIKSLLGIFIMILDKINPKKDVILFHSDYYRDNARYIYENIKDRVKAEKLVWILNDKQLVKELNESGIDAVFSMSISGFLTLSRLKMIITTNLPPIATSYINPIIVQVFHGFGTKQTPTDREYESKLEQIRRIIRKVDYIICLSERDTDYFFPREKLQVDDVYPTYLPIGLPRNDVLLNQKKSSMLQDEISKFFNLGKDSKIILYAPTWREKPEGNDFDDFWFFNREETDEFISYLRKNNYVLLLRPHHHCLKLSNVREKILELVEGNSDVLKIAGADVWSDTQEILCVSEMLITDFSSIYVDYLLTQRPIVYLDMDTKEYVKHRGLVIDYYNDLHTPGPKIKGALEVMNYLEGVKAGWDKYEVIREESLHFYHDYPDGNSSQRVGDLVLKLLEN